MSRDSDPRVRRKLANQCHVAGGRWPMDTKRERMEPLCFGAPTLRYLYKTILRDAFATSNDASQRRPKLLVMEATVLVAWWYEIVWRYALVNVKIMHAGLNQQKRTKLTNEFLDIKSDLQVLVIMYDVPAQGLNWHTVCPVAFRRHGGSQLRLRGASMRTLPLRISQAGGPQIPLGHDPWLLQGHRVKIIRKIVEITHDLWLNARQADRVMLKLASRARDARERKTLIRALNEARSYVRDLEKAGDAGRIKKHRKAYDGKQATVGGR